MNLARHPHLLARYEPDRIAIEQGNYKVSYGTLEDMSRAIAHRLRDAGLGRGDICALRARDDVASLAAMFAVWRLGAVLMPLDWRSRPAEASRVVTRFKPRLVVTTGPEQTVEGQLSLGSDDIRGIRDRGELPIAPVEDEPALFALSSGTTGEPKAAVITHRQHQARVLSYAVSYPILRDDRYLSTLPIAYNWGRNLAVSHLCLGATLILHPILFAAEELAGAVEACEATTLAAVPYVSRALLQWANAGPPVLGRLRRYFSSTAPLFPEERRQIRAHVAPNLTETYGTTETGGLCVLPPEDQDRAPGSVGRPAFGVEIQIVDEANGVLARGDTGMIRCRGPGVIDGYARGSSSDGDRFRHGWYYPGDSGSIDGQGFVYLAGRSADIIKRGGMTIHAAEIERVLAAHPAVQEAAVIGLPSADIEEEIAAFVVLRHEVDLRELETYCRISLVSHKQPRQITILPSLPRSDSGKIAKSALPGSKA